MSNTPTQQAWGDIEKDMVESTKDTIWSHEDTWTPVPEAERSHNKLFILVKKKKRKLLVSHSPWTQNPGCSTHPACTSCSTADFHSSALIGVQTRRPGGIRGGPVRSAGPCMGGVMLIGAQPPCSSPLQLYRSAAHPRRPCKVIVASGPQSHQDVPSDTALTDTRLPDKCERI